MQRRWLMGAVGAWAGLVGQGVGAQPARERPRPLLVVVPAAAGSGTDASARVLTRLMADALGRPATVIDRPGNGGRDGLTAVASAAPGTLGVLTTRLALLGHGAAAGWTPIGLYGSDAAAFHVRAEAPWADLAQLLDAVAGGSMVGGSGGSAGGIWHLALAGLLRAAGLPLDAVGWQPRRRSASAIAALLAGEVDLVVCSLADAQAAGAPGALRALAVASDERLAAFPTVPTVAEATGLDWTTASWHGLVGPPGLKAPEVAPLVAALATAHARPEFQSAMAARGYRPLHAGPEAFQALIETTVTRLGPIADALTDG